MQAAELYHTNRTFSAIVFSNEVNRSVATLLSEAMRLTNIVRGTNIVIITTNVIEKQTAISISYGSALEAWNAALAYTGTSTNYPGKIFDNVGWVRGTKFVNGGWGAYLWVIQNEITFLSSTANWWRVSTTGAAVVISKVLVGSLGDYDPLKTNVDIGPRLDAATNNFPGINQSDSREFKVDLTNVFYRIVVPLWITPRSAYACVGGSNVKYSVTTTNITNGVTWSIIPSGVGAEIYPSNDWHYAGVTPGNVATNYKVRATSKDNTNFYDQVDLTVLKIDIEQTVTNVCWSVTSASLNLTADSFMGDGTADWSSEPSGISGSGMNITFNPSALTPTTYIVRAQSSLLTNCFDTCTVTVIKMELDWEAISSALDDNTNWNGGKRIFPDKQSPDDIMARDNVGLRAKLTPALPNVRLYFKAFDVDDPTPASIDTNAVIDTTGKQGNDNHGSPKAGTLSATSNTTDGSGEVLIEFTVTKQPGDNFRAAVALSAAELNKLTVTDTNSASYVSPDNSLPGNFFGGISPMLTVWRRLWIEFDSLGTWPSTGDEKNFQTGQITGIQSNMPAAGQSTLQLDILLLDEENRYQGGYIQIAGVGQFTILYNNYDLQLLVQTVVIQGVPTQNVVGQTFTIYDDDNVEVNLDPPRLMPYSLSGGSLINTAFADAYIKPEPVPVTYIDNNVPFNRNMVYGGLGYSFDWLPTVSHGRDLNESEDFWYAYVLAAFQPEILVDHDPYSSFPTLGLTDIGLSRSAIYVETIRENEWQIRMPRTQEEHAIVHEIGHQGGVFGHNYKGIMEEGSPTDEDKFAPENIKKFRDKPIF